ncbi:GspE/PulE family protein [Candidatus Woesebacteria bacterium]|nr:GspE/PulE family protein [Candidatus Woesebacteria bacterium]
MALLRTDEHQEAQDGKISYEVDAETLDIRVSIVPVVNGEKVVLRLLSERSRKFSLRDLGLSEAGLKKVQAAYKNPHGMILATGPTGSGKTTTLYSVLKELNSRSVNIMTIEDPVEYEIENVNQMQVTHTGDVTFASGLRSIVRQDPNIILVGEIRDEETADIAINAAMTGHLVLSTLHTNDAVTAFPRLIDMGVEPYLVSSTVNVVIAQRLLRKICTSCRVSRTVQTEELKVLDPRYTPLLQGRTMYVGKGCPVCGHSGYRGRVGVFEVLVMNDDLRAAIADKHDASYLHTLAVKSGMKTMMQDGVEKVAQGITSLEEVIRVLHD